MMRICCKIMLDRRKQKVDKISDKCYFATLKGLGQFELKFEAFLPNFKRIVKTGQISCPLKICENIGKSRKNLENFGMKGEHYESKNGYPAKILRKVGGVDFC